MGARDMAVIRDNFSLFISFLVGLGSIIVSVYLSTRGDSSVEPHEQQLIVLHLAILALFYSLMFHVRGAQAQTRAQLIASVEQTVARFATSAGFENSQYSFEGVTKAVRYLEQIMPQATVIKNTRLASGRLPGLRENEVSKHDQAILKALNNGAHVKMVCCESNLKHQAYFHKQGLAAVERSGDSGSSFFLYVGDFANQPLPQMTILEFNSVRPPEVLVGWRIANANSGKALLLRGKDAVNRLSETFDRYIEFGRVVENGDFH